MKKFVIGSIMKIVVLTVLVTLAIAFNNNYSFALSDVTDSSSDWFDWEPTYQGTTSTFSEKAGTILGIIQVIGILISVGSLAYIGIKFMLGSVEEKASYKQTLFPWIVGATMVFALTTIPSVIYKITESTLSTEDDDISSKVALSGYVQGVKEAAGKSLISSKEALEEARDEAHDKANEFVDSKYKGIADTYDLFLDHTTWTSVGALAKAIGDEISNYERGLIENIQEEYDELKSTRAQSLDNYGRYIAITAIYKEDITNIFP